MNAAQNSNRAEARYMEDNRYEVCKPSSPISEYKSPTQETVRDKPHNPIVNPLMLNSHLPPSPYVTTPSMSAIQDEETKMMKMMLWRQYSDGSSPKRKEEEICGILNQHGAPCHRVGKCPFHSLMKDKKASPKRGWTKDEHTNFLKGLKLHGKGNWKEIAAMVQTKSSTQIQSHAQKYFLRQKQTLKNKRSIHDFSLEDYEAEQEKRDFVALEQKHLLNIVDDGNTSKRKRIELGYLDNYDSYPNISRNSQQQSPQQQQQQQQNNQQQPSNVVFGTIPSGNGYFYPTEMNSINNSNTMNNMNNMGMNMTMNSINMNMNINMNNSSPLSPMYSQNIGNSSQFNSSSNQNPNSPAQNLNGLQRLYIQANNMAPNNILFDRPDGNSSISGSSNYQRTTQTINSNNQLSKTTNSVSSLNSSLNNPSKSLENESIDYSYKNSSYVLPPPIHRDYQSINSTSPSSSNNSSNNNMINTINSNSSNTNGLGYSMYNNSINLINPMSPMNNLNMNSMNSSLNNSSIGNGISVYHDTFIKEEPTLAPIWKDYSK